MRKGDRITKHTAKKKKSEVPKLFRRKGGGGEEEGNLNDRTTRGSGSRAVPYRSLSYSGVFD